MQFFPLKFTAKIPLILGMVLLLWAGTWGQKAEVVFKKSAEVDPGTVYLSQVAKIKGDAKLVQQLSNLAVGQANYPGRSTRLSVNTIESFYLRPLNSQGAEISIVGMGSIEVKARARYLSQKELAEKLLAQVSPQMQGKKGHDWDIDIRRLPSKIALPLQDVQIVVELPGRFSGQGQETAVLQVLQNQKVLSRHNLSFVIKKWGTVVKAKRPIQRQQIVRAEDLKVERVELTNNRRRIVQNTADVVGRTALRTIGRNMQIYDNWLERPYLVRNGDPVQLNVAVGTGIISIAALAKQNGYEGQVIEVLNESSRQVVRAKITKAGEAWVIN